MFLAAGLALTAATAEVWFRLTTPFIATRRPLQFVPDVGFIGSPHAEVHWTNHLDFWTVQRSNSLGFLDREPVSPERAAASCHVAVIGDSFTSAHEVPISEKFHVRLEDLAARELPNLDVTTSAFGRRATGQLNQLPFYDEFARRLLPKLLVLVFVINDFMDNAPLLDALEAGRDPDRIPWVSAQRNADGTMTLRPAHPDWGYRLPLPPLLPRPLYVRVLGAMIRMSWFARWLDAKTGALFPPHRDPRLIARAEVLSRRPGYDALLDGWQPTTPEDIRTTYFRRKDLPPVFEDALDFTAFALDQFKERTDRDGVSLAILSTHPMGTRGHPAFDRLHAMAEARGIPVIDQYDYILRQGAEPEDAQWAHDSHWNPAGHQWAAEVLLDYLKRNRDVCDGPIGRAERGSRIAAEPDTGTKRPAG